MGFTNRIYGWTSLAAPVLRTCGLIIATTADIDVNRRLGKRRPKTGALLALMWSVYIVCMGITQIGGAPWVFFLEFLPFVYLVIYNTPVRQMQAGYFAITEIIITIVSIDLICGSVIFFENGLRDLWERQKGKTGDMSLLDNDRLWMVANFILAVMYVMGGLSLLGYYCISPWRKQSLTVRFYMSIYNYLVIIGFVDFSSSVSFWIAFRQQVASDNKVEDGYLAQIDTVLGNPSIVNVARFNLQSREQTSQ